MKYLVFLLFTFLLVPAYGVFGASIEVIDISTLSEREVQVTFSSNPNLRVGTVDAEVKVFQDISLTGRISSQELGKIELILEDPLFPNTNYSLLTILGAEGSMDFKTPQDFNNKTLVNLSQEQGEDIRSITIQDSRTILVRYIQEISETEFEYKLLAESKVESIENRDYDDGKIYIELSSGLLVEKDYIVMFIDMQDVDGVFLDFEAGIYDFTTPSTLEKDTGEMILAIQNNQEEEGTTQDDVNILPVPNNNKEVILPEITIIEQKTHPLKAAGEEIVLEGTTNIVAQQVSETPDTGAETWVLIFASLFINTIFYLSRRKKYSLA